MPTSVTNAANQTSSLQYDFYLGRPVDAQDANGTIYTGYSDNDTLDRPTKVVSRLQLLDAQESEYFQLRRH